MDAARRAAEAAARTSYGRLVALIASRSGDIAGAEEALADAFAAALKSWPVKGVPDSPDAWLLTAARRTIGHTRARAATATAGEATLMLLDDERAQSERLPFGDERLTLLFVCAHPAIDADVRTPLMLQTVLGLDAARIAAAFLVSPAAMARKLSRAKLKIRAAGIAFAVPDVERLAPRLSSVCAAIYAAYGTGWEDVAAADVRRRGLSSEAVWLARLVTDLVPGDAEAMGLLSLMLYCEARAATRRDASGAFVPLDQQDARAWSPPMLAEAEALLRAAARHHRPGRFQTEAAIQSLHAQAAMTGEDLSEPLTALYDLLVTLTPALGAAVARAVAYAQAGRVAEADAMLKAVEVPDYQPWWAARARTAWLSGDVDAARAAADHAAGLSNDPAVRDFLLGGGLFR